MQKFKQRIVEYARKRYDMGQTRFEEKCGIHPGTISAIKSNGPTAAVIMKIANSCPDLNLNWLYTGEGSMIIEKCGGDEHSTLPLVPREALAHTGTPAFKKDDVEYYYNVRELNHRSDFLVKAKGDYMMPKYNGGDLIACRYVRDLLYFQWGRMYFISTRSQGEFIRRVLPASEPDKITCSADNQKYKPFVIPKSDILSIALVKGAVTFE